MKALKLVAVLATAAVLFAQDLTAQPFTFTAIAGTPGMGGSADGTNKNATFIAPAGMVLDSAGNLYVVDPNMVRKISPVGTNWVVTTFAGVALPQGSEDGTSTNARFRFPQGIAADAANNLYVADTYNHTIRKITPGAVVSTLAGEPRSIGTNDGLNAAARFNYPFGITSTPAGVLFVADTRNHTIRQVSFDGANWVTTTIAGKPETPGTANGVGAAARFNEPAAIARDTDGTLYVADFQNHAIRKMTFAANVWTVTTFAGLPGVAGSSDGQGSTARFNQPQGLAIDSAHCVYVADAGNHTIRRITPAGVVRTIGGRVGHAGIADGTGSQARFDAPYGLAVDSAGNLFVADNYSYSIHRGRLAALLDIRLTSTQCILSWPSGLTNYVPQVNSKVSATGWTTLPSGISLVDTFNYQTNSRQPGGAFYRLIKP
ncbi:MAG TPA: NHL repeat-containing protein [Candidatus Paceibacterota bacterium]|nr:NHL repeat-containing protein [Candidatus Paceibacterota bacterium]